MEEQNPMERPQDQAQSPEQGAPRPLTARQLWARRRWFCCSSCAYRECDLLCDCPCHDPYGLDRAA
jgi:hypothetical protein